MAAHHFDLPAELEALLQQVCAEENVPARRQDELRELVSTSPSSWPVCCGASCQPCVEDSKALAREILARWHAPPSTSP
jgi:hypothetical protein